MSPAVIALLGFVALSISLVACFLTWRTVQVLKGRPANTFNSRGGVENAPDFVERAKNAHLNCIENLPLFAAVVGAAYMANQLSAIEALAYPYLALRVAQSVIHLIGTSHWLVMARVACFVPQLVILGIMIAKLCTSCH